MKLNAGNPDSKFRFGDPNAQPYNYSAMQSANMSVDDSSIVSAPNQFTALSKLRNLRSMPKLNTNISDKLVNYVDHYMNEYHKPYEKLEDDSFEEKRRKAAKKKYRLRNKGLKGRNGNQAYNGRKQSSSDDDSSD